MAICSKLEKPRVLQPSHYTRSVTISSVDQEQAVISFLKTGRGRKERESKCEWRLKVRSEGDKKLVTGMDRRVEEHNEG